MARPAQNTWTSHHRRGYATTESETSSHSARPPQSPAQFNRRGPPPRSLLACGKAASPLWLAKKNTTPWASWEKCIARQPRRRRCRRLLPTSREKGAELKPKRGRGTESRSARRFLAALFLWLRSPRQPKSRDRSSDFSAHCLNQLPLHSDLSHNPFSVRALLSQVPVPWARGRVTLKSGWELSTEMKRTVSPWRVRE